MHSYFYRLLIVILISFKSGAVFAQDNLDRSSAREISYRSIAKAESQLQTFLKWVLKEHGTKTGTFYFPRLTLKAHCDPVKHWKGKETDAALRKMYEDTVGLNQDCLQELPFLLWVEGNMILGPVFISPYIINTLPEGDKNTDSAIRLAVPPHNFTDLCSDVVPTSDDIGGSTYLEDREWAFNKIHTALNGDKIVVTLP